MVGAGPTDAPVTAVHGCCSAVHRTSQVQYILLASFPADMYVHGVCSATLFRETQLPIHHVNGLLPSMQLQRI